MTAVCFVDVETTGTEPDRHELWEIGLIVRRPAGEDPPLAGGSHRDLEYAWHILPDLSVANPHALRIGRYYQRMKATDRETAVVLRESPVDGGCGRRTNNPPVGRVANDLARMVDGCVLVAVNVDFDAAFLDKFLRTHAQCPTWDYHKVEVLSLAAGHLHLPPPWTSTTITEALGVPREADRHTGLGDARLVRDIYDRVYAPTA